MLETLILCMAGLSDGDDGGRHLSQEQKICTGRSGKQEWLEGTLQKRNLITDCAGGLPS